MPIVGYYAGKLSGRELQRCYEVASERVRQYLEAEIEHALSRVRAGETVLELGCGYGRIAERFALAGCDVVGIDTAYDSLRFARESMLAGGGFELVCADAVRLGFRDVSFDAVLCLQNGVCAFGVDPVSLVREALRVTRTAGLVLLSSYSDAFWPHRLSWFEAQAAEGLLGPIDYDATGDGVIVCKDGLRVGRMTPDDFRSVCSQVCVEGRIFEVDGSSLFCEIVKSADAR